MTQEMLAERLGADQSFISKFERGVRTAPLGVRKCAAPTVIP